MAARSAIHTALRAKLVAAAAVTALVSQRVLNIWSPGTVSAYPALFFGFISESEPNESGMRFQLWQFSAVTSGRSESGVLDVLEAVRGVLHMSSLSPTGWTVYEMRAMSERMVGVADDEYAHAEFDLMICCKPT